MKAFIVNKLFLITRNKKLSIGLAMIVVFTAVGLFAPLIAPYGPDEAYVGKSLQPPSSHFLFGTDRLGRDLFSRVVFGTRVSLVASVSITCICLLIGVPIGLISGFYGRVVDNILMRIADIFFSIPWVLMGLLVAVVRGASLSSVIIALSLTYAPRVVRVARATTLSIKEKDFVLAARLTGESDLSIIFRYILPNCLAPVIVQITIIMSFSILGEAALSYLGYGTRPPTPSWGSLLQQATNYLWTGRYLVIFPGIFIVFSVLAFNYCGDGLRDLFDPRYKRLYGI